jgi:hypothetical protein
VLYFLFEDKFYQQKERKATGSSHSPVIINMVMEYSEKIALDTEDNKPPKRLRCDDDTFIVWPHGPAKITKILSPPQQPQTYDKIHNGSGNTLPFTDIVVMKKGPNLTTKVSRKLANKRTSSPCA